MSGADAGRDRTPGLVFTSRAASLSSRAPMLYTLHVEGCSRIGDAEVKPLSRFPGKGLPLLTRIRADLNAKACAYCKPLVDHARSPSSDRGSAAVAVLLAVCLLLGLAGLAVT